MKNLEKGKTKVKKKMLEKKEKAFRNADVCFLNIPR